MRAGILSAGLWSVAASRQAVTAETPSIVKSCESLDGQWDIEEFERDQLRGLVRQVFLAGEKPPVRQVIVAGIEPQTEVFELCGRVGELLADEISGDVALADESHSSGVRDSEPVQPIPVPIESPRESATRLGRNLFWLPGRESVSGHRAVPMRLYLEQLRREFEYSIVAAPAAGVSRRPLAMAQTADGIVLVLSARRTRRVVALNAIKSLGSARLLGTVLCEREFPVPWGIYRRL